MSGTKNAVHFVMNRTQRAKMSARYYTHSDHGVLKNSKTLFNTSQNSNCVKLYRAYCIVVTRTFKDSCVLTNLNCLLSVNFLDGMKNDASYLLHLVNLIAT